MLNLNPKKLIPVTVDDVTFCLAPPLGETENAFIAAYRGAEAFVSNGADITDTAALIKAKDSIIPFLRDNIKEWYSSEQELLECTKTNIANGLSITVALEIFTQYSSEWGAKTEDLKN